MTVITRSQSKSIREKQFGINTNVVYSGYKHYTEFCYITSRLSTCCKFTNKSTKQYICFDVLYSEVCSLRYRAKNTIAFIEQTHDPSIIVFAFNLVNRLMNELKIQAFEYPEVDVKIKPILTLEILENEVSNLSNELSNGLLKLSDGIVFRSPMIMGYKLGEKFCRLEY